MSDKPIAYEEDGHVYYRASAIGGCLVALAAARQQLEPKPNQDQKMQEIFDAGHKAEDAFNLLFPDTLKERQMEVRLDITGRISVVGHLDGLHGERIGEVKSQSDDEYDSWRPSHWTDHPLWVKYSWQTSSYMLALDRELSLFRVRRSNPEDFSIWVVERPFHSLDEIRERVLEAEALAREDTLLCTGPFSYPCPYHYLHQECPICDDEELLQAVCDYDISGQNIKAQQEIKDRARKVIEGYLLDKGEEGKLMTSTGYKLSRSEFDTKERVIPAGHQTRVTVTKSGRTRVSQIESSDRQKGTL